MKHKLTCLMVVTALLASTSVQSTAATKKPAAKAKSAATVKKVAPKVAATPPPLVDERAISTDPKAVVAEFDRWLDQLDASDKVAGLAVAVVSGNQVLLERGLGYEDWATREPITADSVFRLASLSKAFATTLTGILVNDGMLSWETRVSGVLPTFSLKDADGGQKLTVRDILSHRVGLPHNTYDNLIEQDEPYPLLVDRLKDVPMSCPVGECYGYQNIAFSLIGDITYAITGDFFYHLVAKRIFHPLGMATATYGRDALESSAHWARPHVRAGKSWRSFQPKENYYHMPPAAGVNASLRDMEKWLIAQMGHQPSVLSAQLLKQLQEPQVETPRDKSSTPWRRGRVIGARYALGWRIYDYAGEPMVFHAGAVQGYRALMAFLPQRDFGLIMLWNSESGAPSGLMPMLFDRYLGLPQVDWAGVGMNARTDIATGGD